jgi:uncharacterized cupredoxin-like copper-binding protein
VSCRLLRSRIVAASAVGLLLLLGACGGGSGDPAKGPEVKVKERDFHISAPRRIAAGHVRLVVTNKGPDAHELVITSTGGGPLPASRDGLRVDEDGLRDSEELEAADPGTRTLELNLRPGRYVLFCNMAGHFRGGMHTEVLVH